MTNGNDPKTSRRRNGKKVSAQEIEQITDPEVKEPVIVKETVDENVLFEIADSNGQPTDALVYAQRKGTDKNPRTVFRIPHMNVEADAVRDAQRNGHTGALDRLNQSEKATKVTMAFLLDNKRGRAYINAHDNRGKGGEHFRAMFSDSLPTKRKTLSSPVKKQLLLTNDETA